MTAWFLSHEVALGDEFHRIQLEIGLSGERESGQLQARGSVAAEYTAIEHRLATELELSTAGYDGGIEVPVELHIKRPIQLSPTQELNPGFGPQYATVLGTDKNGGFWGGEVLLEFRNELDERFGFLVEPTYSFLSRKGIEQEFGIEAGLTLAL